MIAHIDDAESAPVAATRQVSTFSWHAVPPEVVGRLLLADYSMRNIAGRYARDIDEINRLSDIGLAHQAALVFNISNGLLFVQLGPDDKMDTRTSPTYTATKSTAIAPDRLLQWDSAPYLRRDVRGRNVAVRAFVGGNSGGSHS